MQPRDVNYVYGDADPERVTALTNFGGGTTYAGYAYDAAGNMTQRCTGGSGVPSCAGESTEYVYDGKDQLRRATKKLNGVVEGSEEYWYDGDGQRIAVVKRDAAATKTELIWFIGDAEAHYDGTGNLDHIYSHLSLGTPVARVDRTSNTATSVEYQFHGLASSTLAAVANDGTINASFRYTPWGAIVEAGGTTSGSAAHRRRHNDKYIDDLSSLAYYGVRYYDKTLIGWSQSDPLFRFAPDAAWTQPRKALLYTYSLQNPLRYVDPDGRMPGAMALGPAAPIAVGVEAAVALVGFAGEVVAGLAVAAIAATAMNELGIIDKDPGYTMTMGMDPYGTYQRAQAIVDQQDAAQASRDQSILDSSSTMASANARPILATAKDDAPPAPSSDDPVTKGDKPFGEEMGADGKPVPKPPEFSRRNKKKNWKSRGKEGGPPIKQKEEPKPKPEDKGDKPWGKDMGGQTPQ